jgi:hypothetical protein
MNGCDGRWRLRQIESVKPFASGDPKYESSGKKAECIRT